MCKRNIDRLPLAHPQPGTWPVTQAHALTGNLASDLSVGGTTLNPLKHTSQGLYAGFILETFLKEQPGKMQRALDRKLEILGPRPGSTANSPGTLHKPSSSSGLSLPICTMSN